MCLPHLRRALIRVQDEDILRFLAEVAVDKLSPLLIDLREYERKHSWNNRDEPKYPWEQASWIRAVAFFGGEAEERTHESVYQVRQKALTDYCTRAGGLSEEDRQPQSTRGTPDVDDMETGQ